jgi:oxygen-independent coproporphyrinogen-3 oxidase
MTELRLRNRECRTPVDSIYLGGGTPGLLSIGQIERLLAAARDTLPVTDTPEITIELNPENATPRYLKALLRAGINRVSLGIQSLSDQVLRLIGRRYGRKTNLKAVQALADTFSNWSLDLILGLPGRSLGELLSEVRTLVESEPPHLSLYGLHLSRNAPLKTLLKKNRRHFPEDRREYFESAELLEDFGYTQYEISNWSTAGKNRSRHNLHYWNTDPIFAVGPAAAGTLDGVRRTNRPDLEGYLKNLTAGKLPACRKESLTEIQQHNEYVMMRLRLAEGIRFSEYRERIGADFLERFGSLCEEIQRMQFGILTGNGFRLNREGWYVSNSLISRFFL